MIHLPILFEYLYNQRILKPDYPRTFCVNSSSIQTKTRPARGVLEIRDGEDL